MVCPRAEGLLLAGHAGISFVAVERRALTSSGDAPAFAVISAPLAMIAIFAVVVIAAIATKTVWRSTANVRGRRI